VQTIRQLTSPEFEFGAQFGRVASASDILADLRGQNVRGSQFIQALARIGKRRIAEMLSELSGLGVGSLANIQAIAGAPRGVFTDVQRAFTRGERQAA
jgi:hypothetical protein